MVIMDLMDVHSPTFWARFSGNKYPHLTLRFCGPHRLFLSLWWQSSKTSLVQSIKFTPHLPLRQVVPSHRIRKFSVSRIWGERYIWTVGILPRGANLCFPLGPKAAESGQINIQFHGNHRDKEVLRWVYHQSKVSPMTGCCHARATPLISLRLDSTNGIWELPHRSAWQNMGIFKVTHFLQCTWFDQDRQVDKKSMYTPRQTNYLDACYEAT